MVVGFVEGGAYSGPRGPVGVEYVVVHVVVGIG